MQINSFLTYTSSSLSFVTHFIEEDEVGNLWRRNDKRRKELVAEYNQLKMSRIKKREQQSLDEGLLKTDGTTSSFWHAPTVKLMFVSYIYSHVQDLITMQVSSKGSLFGDQVTL